MMNYYASWQECHEALVRQLYDEQHGWYQVVELIDGRYRPCRVLSRAEALAWINPDPRLNDPVTVSEAALMLFGADGARELMRINRLIESGVLQEYVAANEPNPRRARRLSRSEVQAYKRMRSQRK